MSASPGWGIALWEHGVRAICLEMDLSIPNGYVTFVKLSVKMDVAPAYWNYYSDNMTWPAALFMSVDMCYTQYGNTLPMRQSYASMKRWMNHMVEEYMTDEYIFTKDRYGDSCLLNRLT